MFNAESGYRLPGLDAPVDRLATNLLDFLASHGVEVATGDTVFNLLLKLRDVKGISYEVVPIEKPY